MDENRMEILKMLQEGRISAEEAMELLKALEPREMTVKPDGERMINLNDEDYGEPEEETGEDEAPRKKKKPKFLIIEVTKDGSKKVNVRVPLKLAKMASRFIPKHAHQHMKEQGIEGNLNDLLDGLDELEPGEDLLNVMDDDDEEQVRIYMK